MLSIIVPVYNVEKYLKKCINSIVNQTYKDIEIILVDDGSTDESGEICDQWAKRDSRIVVYHKSNGGLMSAWKYGVERANGGYIGFVDSDDWIDRTMYEVMISTMEREKCDLVGVALQKNYEDGSVNLEPVRLKEKIYRRSEIVNDIFPKFFISKEVHGRIISPNRVTKVFKKEKMLYILDNCSDTVSIGEDLITTFNYMQICDSVYLINDFYPYHYRINACSMIRKFDARKYEKIKELRACLLECDEKFENYDFAAQINADFVDLIIRNMEDHILDSNSKTLRKDILNLWKDPTVQHAANVVDRRLLPGKDRFYMFLLNCKMINTLIWVRKLKKVK